MATQLPNDTQSFDVRLYFDNETPREEIEDAVSAALQNSAALAGARMISAYELVNNGFAMLVPADRPLA